MTKPAPQPEGIDVYVITYDDKGGEQRFLPADVPDDVVGRSRSLGIGLDGVMERIDHGPFVAAESELRGVRLSSLVAAVDGNY